MPSKTSHAPKKPARRTPPQQVRIIGGQWKRTPLPVPDAQGLRPTPDRVRETVFNWLTHLFDGAWEGVACIDMFAGSGALGFEAASRGAGQVVMIEENPVAIRQLQAIKEKLKADQVEIVRGDAMARAQLMSKAAFQLIFLDPPYHQDWLPKILPLCAPLLAPAGLVYAESEEPLKEEEFPAWEVVRADKAGMVFYQLLRKRKNPEIQA